MSINDDVAKAIKDLGDEGRRIVVSAAKQSFGNVEAMAKAMCPVGHFKAGRGSPGRPGGELQNSLRVEFLGADDDAIHARCTSDKVYARIQHESEFFHPGKYTGVPGPQFKSQFFARGVEIVFGSGNDPLGIYGGPFPAGFQELLEEGVKK